GYLSGYDVLIQPFDWFMKVSDKDCKMISL
ncbi:MAG: hypothetical protein ACI9GZ_003299, partial [Bacteroidia bacterium]